MLLIKLVPLHASWHVFSLNCVTSTLLRYDFTGYSHLLQYRVPFYQYCSFMNELFSSVVCEVCFSVIESKNITYGHNKLLYFAILLTEITYDDE